MLNELVDNYISSMSKYDNIAHHLFEYLRYSCSMISNSTRPEFWLEETFNTIGKINHITSPTRK